jgi:hypothetical protein
MTVGQLFRVVKSYTTDSPSDPPKLRVLGAVAKGLAWGVGTLFVATRTDWRPSATA